MTTQTKPQPRLKRLEEDSYGRKQWRCGDYTVTRWDFDLPIRSHCYRLTCNTVCLAEAKTLVEILEYISLHEVRTAIGKGATMPEQTKPQHTAHTPRTDAAILKVEGGCSDSFDYVTPAFARQLERENDELVSALEGMLAVWEDQFGEGTCDCRPEPQNQGHVCQCCLARIALGREPK